MKILIVDDNSHDREALKFYLDNNGFPGAEIAVNEKECIEKALEIHPDVVILDVFLDDRPSYGVCHAIKNHEQLNCVVIMMTGEFHKNDPSQASKATPDYYLAKTGVYRGLLKILERLSEK